MTVNLRRELPVKSPKPLIPATVPPSCISGHCNCHRSSFVAWQDTPSWCPWFYSRSHCGYKELILLFTFPQISLVAWMLLLSGVSSLGLRTWFSVSTLFSTLLSFLFLLSFYPGEGHFIKQWASLSPEAFKQWPGAIFRGECHAFL